MISIIAAIGNNNELGNNNDLLWHLPNDLKHFKALTSGRTIIMGRKTWESLPFRPLPNRRNIVITRDTNAQFECAEVFPSIESALNSTSNEEVFIIGGGQIYAQALPFADRLYITHVDGTFDANVFFPEINTTVWKQVSKEAHSSDEKHPYLYAFAVWEK